MEKMALINELFWKNKNVFITGHTGFKGSWLLLWLIKLGSNVTGYSLKPDNNFQLFKNLYPNIKDKFKHIEGDIRDLENLRESILANKPDIIFHLAAQPLVRESYLKPIETWEINTIGTLNILEAASKSLENVCSIIIVTTDKVYENKEWTYGYRETDRLGGYDPYSASKAGAEIAVSSWRNSFCNNINQTKNSNLHISTCRAGNVIGGGDWAKDRIVPDAINYLQNGQIIKLRNPNAKRPWQHVLEPLSGYILLAEKLYFYKELAESFNFGPLNKSNISVCELIQKIIKYWGSGDWESIHNNNEPHEAKLLQLQIDKAYNKLNWEPVLDIDKTVSKTVNWYKSYLKGETSYMLCLKDINNFQEIINKKNI